MTDAARALAERVYGEVLGWRRVGTGWADDEIGVQPRWSSHELPTGWPLIGLIDAKCESLVITKRDGRYFVKVLIDGHFGMSDWVATDPAEAVARAALAALEEA